MEIRDVLHGAIRVEKSEIPILDSRYFQRLRQIKQLGFAEQSFPSATHNRYIHSLGAMHVATRAFDQIFRSFGKEGTQRIGRFRPVLRLAALLHDVGHGPLSHTTEFAMPEAKRIGLNTEFFSESYLKNVKSRQATHEDYTLKLILDSGLTPLLEKAGHAHGFGARHVAALIEPAIKTGDDFFLELGPGEATGKRADFRPILGQLISSELDADRMDYLRRDSLHAGVSYGQFDYDWLLANLTWHIHEDRCGLALEHRALYSFEDFLISRFHMFLMVYFHHKSVVYDAMLGRYFETAGDEYLLPADVEAYAECDDAHLMARLGASSNPWARRITEKYPYRMLIELHSGIPSTKTASVEQTRLATRLKRDLSTQKIDYLDATSTSELSKYHRRPGDPIFVRYDNHYNQPSFIPLASCTDLFAKYGEKRSISRLYVSPEDYPRLKRQGRHEPLAYRDPVVDA